MIGNIQRKDVAIVMSGFGSNIAALKAQRRLSTVTSDLSQVNERLSSGQRINRASDDAAGLAIATTLNAKGRIYGQSIRNVSDAISALSIADGVTSDLSGVITRLKELATQAANGSYSSTQRAAINKEAQSLQAEYNRLIDATAFNGMRILNHTTGRMVVQAGSTSAQGLLSINPSNIATGHAGAGSFATAKSYNAGAGVERVKLGDFNQDGYKDLVSLDGDSNSISVQLGNGDGSFRTTKAIVASPFNPRSMAVADLNGDGRDDFVVAGEDGYQVFAANSDGSFLVGSTVAISLATGIGGRAMALGDINGDGKLDIVYGDRHGNVITINGNGNGTFSKSSEMQIDISQAGVGDAVTSLTLGDINGDGILDLGIGSETDVNPAIVFGNGNGTFKNRQTLTFNHSSIPISTLEFADLNGDGKKEILVGNLGSDFSSYQNLTGTTFGNEVTQSGVGGVAIGVADFNGDGILDIVGSDGSSLTIQYGLGNVTFGAAKSITANGGINLAIGDLNGDGVADIVSADDSSGGEAILTNTNSTSYLDSLDLTTLSGAYAALRSLDTSLSALGQARGRIGADQSRLQAALSVLGATRDNFAAAESRIKDVDVAAESANLTKDKILQQTAAQVLGLANFQPQIMLDLLK